MPTTSSPISTKLWRGCSVNHEELSGLHPEKSDMTMTQPSSTAQLTIRRPNALRGRIRVPGDKSISHRTLLLGCLADGRSHVRGFLPSNDCLATLSCIRALGVEVETSDSQMPTNLTIDGNGLRRLRKPDAALNCVRSGTTMRLLAGVVAGQSFDTVLSGEAQLRRRPMERIARPLRRMGAVIETTEGHAPLTIQGRRLHGHEHVLPVASAQVKSAILLAGLHADGPTVIHQRGPARDHTELMLQAMGAALEISGLSVTLTPTASPLAPLDMTVPGDISSASFPLVAGLLVPGSQVTVESVGVNPTRTGLLDVLRGMGADVVIRSQGHQGGEPAADVTARASNLKATELSGDTVVRMIDEFPLLAVAATQARGTTVVRDASELRVKETDRIAVIASQLSKMGAHIEPQPDGFAVTGPTPLRGTAVDSHGDHRIAMALTVAGLIAAGETTLQNPTCIRDSFPGFVETMQRLGASVV
jgi:3-phosphoshikimate 1-carboxyvinyltransferase